MIDLFKYLKPKEEKEEEKETEPIDLGIWGNFDPSKWTTPNVSQNKIDLSKYIVLKGEVKAGVRAKAEGGIKLETKKEEPNVFDTLNESIEKNYKQYQSMTKKLESYQAEYDYSPDSVKPSIAANFNKLVGQHDDLIKQLQNDIGKRDQIITTTNKANFMKYKQLTGLPGEIGKPTPLPGPKPIIEGLPISKPEEKPKSILELTGVKKPTTPYELKTGFEKALDPWEEQKKANPELQKIEDLANFLPKVSDLPNFQNQNMSKEQSEIAYLYSLQTDTPLPITIKDMQSNLKKYGSINPPKESWGEYFKREGLLKTILFGPDTKYGKAEKLREQLKNMNYTTAAESFGWKGFILLTGAQIIDALFQTPVKVKGKVFSDEEVNNLFNRAEKEYQGEGKFSSNLSNNDLAAVKTLAPYMRSAIESGKPIQFPVDLKIPQQVNIFGTQVYAGLTPEVIAKSWIATLEAGEKITADMIKGLDPLKLSQVTELLFNYSPAFAIQLMETRAKFAVPEVKAVEKPEVSLAKPEMTIDEAKKMLIEKGIKEEHLTPEFLEKFIKKPEIQELPPGKKEDLTKGLEPELPEFKEEIEREPTAEELRIIDMERQIPENLKKPVPKELKVDYLKIIGKEVKLAKDKMKLTEDIRKDITPSPEILVKYPNLIKELSKPEFTKIEIPKVEIPESLKKPVPPELKDEYLKIIQKEVKPAIDKLKIIKDIKENKPISEGILGKYPELTEKLAKLSETKPSEIKVEAVMPEEKIEKPMVEPEEIEPEPTPEEIRATFMEEENLGTTVKNREYFLSKFGKLFTETKKIEGTLLKGKFNEMQSMIEYEEDDIFKLVSGKEKMRIPKTTKTEWMEGLGKGKYMQIFREDKNLQYPDEIASNLGISEDELREQIIERIRAAPEKVTLESAKQALIDERNSIFMQVNAQMDAYRILLDEIEGGEYSFDTPQNIKRLNTKINTIKDDNKKLMERYEKEITELQKEGIEKRYEELKKKTEAIKNIEVETGIKKGLKIAKEELKGRKLKGMTKEEIEEGNSLIKQIQIMVKDRGFTEKQASNIKMTYGGARSLSGKTKRMTIPQLKAVLKAVEETRPRRIGYKTVITLKTENKIQSLKDNLINKLQMTEETYNEVLKSEGVYKEPKYIDVKNFITEKKGKDIIYRLIDEANILKITLPYKMAVEKNPPLKKKYDEIVNRIKLEHDRRKKDPNELNSMRQLMIIMETITEAPFYPLFRSLVDTHYENKAIAGKLMKEFEEYPKIIKDEIALHRINSYIAAKSTLVNKPLSPKDITPEEVKVANKIEGVLEDYEVRARTEVFLNNIDHPEDMPQYLQYKKEINKAKEIYESKGYDDLVEYLKTQEWGIVTSGYSPLQVFSSKIRLHKPKPQSFGKSHIMPRNDIEYKESDDNILKRLFSYKRQMDNLVSMSPKVRSLITLLDNNLDKFKNTKKIKSIMEVFLRELKGYKTESGLFDRMMNRLYAQAIQTVILLNPGLFTQNILQNVAMECDRTILIDPRNKTLTNHNIDYMDTYIIQTEAMKMNWLMTGEKALPGLAWPTWLINKIGIYPFSEQTNRHWDFWSKVNQVNRSFNNNNDLTQQMKDAKFSDMQLLEQKTALEILAKDGVEAMTEYVSRVHIEDIEFLYNRFERSPAEMGETGKWATNLMLFPRAYWEYFYKQWRKFAGKGSTFTERERAFKVLVSMIVGGWLVGACYKKITGRRVNPYDPFQLLGYKAGGLALGSFELTSDIYVDIIMASKGDQISLANLATELPAAGDMFIPFYDKILRAIEASTNTKNIDKLALRKLRMLINKEYKVRGGDYVVKRNAMEKLQYFLAGAGVDVAIKEREKKGKEKGKFPMKVKVPEGSKSIKPKFSMKVKVPKK